MISTVQQITLLIIKTCLSSCSVTKQTFKKNRSLVFKIILLFKKASHFLTVNYTYKTNEEKNQTEL